MKQDFAIGFPFLFAAMWMAVTTVLGFLSGWFSLMERYPNRDEAPLLRLWMQSGTMGLAVNLNGILILSACPSGLRIGMLRLFGPFCRSFLVPWDEIRVRRKNGLLFRLAELQFGNPKVGHLTLASYVVDRLARAASHHWPEEGSFARETIGEAFVAVLRHWFILTTFGALFFTIVPRVVGGGNGVVPPIEAAIGFPAAVFGLVALVSFISRLRG